MPRTRVILVALALACAGCAGAASSSTTPTPTGTATGTAGAPKPSFKLALAGIVTLSGYASDNSAGLSSCERSKGGGWTYLYAGGTPFVSVDLSVYSGALDGEAPSDFDLDIGAPAGQVRLVPSGRREGAKGTGTAVVEQVADAVRITIKGSARTMVDGGTAGDTKVDLVLRCPS
jgi:hypothetical protein